MNIVTIDEAWVYMTHVHGKAASCVQVSWKAQPSKLDEILGADETQGCDVCIGNQF